MACICNSKYHLLQFSNLLRLQQVLRVSNWNRRDAVLKGYGHRKTFLFSDKESNISKIGLIRHGVSTKFFDNGNLET